MRATVLLTLLFVLGVVPAGADDKKDDTKPAPKLPLGRDTTYVTGPLDRDGWIDYEAALNAELGRGVTAETNANVLLWQAFGPAPEGGDGPPPGFFKWLDIAPPPKGGDYFVGLSTFARETIILTNEQLQAVYEFQSRATQRPWAAKDCPPLAEWIKANEKPTATAVRGTKRPHYFNPLVSRRSDDDPGSLIGALLPSVQKCRELASLLTSRAMLRLGEGKFDAAWEDVLACHRLGRLVSHGGTLIEALVGIAVCQIATNAALTYVDHAKPTAARAAACVKDLQNSPPLASMADKVDVCERIVGLESLQLMWRGGGKFGAGLFELGQIPSAEDQKAMEKIDWTPAMRTMNTGYDKMAAAMRLKDRAARDKAFDAIDKELLATKKAYAKPGDLAKLLDEKDAGKVIGTAIGNVLMSLLSPAVRKVQDAHDRAAQVEQNLYLAFALAAHKADTGRYPAKLADLAPKYLPAVPGDLFNGKPLVYRPEEKGYLFYSVGVNGKDDGGQTYGDDPAGDDLRVKMPIPPLKKD